MQMLEENWEKIFRDAFSQDDIPVMPVRKVIYPFETWHEEVTNPKLLKKLLECYENGKYIGMIYSPKGEKSLPLIGAIGTLAAFSMQRLNKKTYVVKYMGLPRFETIKYLEKGTLYPKTDVEYFCDDDDEDENQLQAELETVLNLMKETDKIRGYSGTNDAYLDSIKKLPKCGLCISFYIMKFWSGDTETRHYMLGLRSTILRLQYAAGLIYKYNQNEAIGERLSRNN
jgi:hypothetical protein